MMEPVRPTVDCLRERLLTLVLAIGLDRLFGEPQGEVHPVVVMGRFANGWLRRAPSGKSSREFAFGAALVATSVGLSAGAALLADRLVGRLPLHYRLPLTAALLKPAFAYRGLTEAADRVQRQLAQGNFDAARGSLAHLVSRDPSSLDAPLIAAAAIQSLAENASDSAIAPWLAYLGGGLPGAYAYRAANTLDAMVGYRNRFEHLGKPAARLDDLLNLLPARVTAVAIAVAAGPSRGSQALAVAGRDHAAPPSPNGGWPMAAMAGALGVRLEKVGHYTLGGSGREPDAADIAAARRLLGRIVAGIGMACAAAGFARFWPAPIGGVP